MAKKNKKNKNTDKNTKGLNVKKINEVVNKTVKSQSKNTKDKTYAYGSYYNKWGFGAKNYTEPTDIKQYNKLNYVVMNQEVLNTIMKKCLPKAEGSEFQFHYWALQVKLTANDGRMFTFTFPLAFFNFNQTVTGGSVDFNLIEVDQEAQKVKEPAKKLAKLIMKSFPKKIFQDLGFNVKFEFGDTGSIHRHPGRFGFSSIDLRYNPLKPGVIYRNKEGHDLWQTDSVLYCASEAELVTTETRVFNIAPVNPQNEDEGSKGTVAEIPTVMIMVGGKEEEEKIPVNDFSDFFGVKKDTLEIKKDYFIKTTMKAQTINEAIEIANALAKIIKPFDFVDENKIDQRYTGYYNRSYGSYGSYGSYENRTIGFNTKSTTTKPVQGVLDLEDDLDLYGYEQHDINKDLPSARKFGFQGEEFYIHNERKDIKTNSFHTQSIILEIMEILEIPDINMLDENSIWELMNNFGWREDLFDMYYYYADPITDRLIIIVDTGKLILDKKKLKMYINDKLVEKDKWRIGEEKK